MKKSIFALAFALTATVASAAQLVEAIVIRVGDRIVTRSQYEKRLREAIYEAEQTVPAADLAGRVDDIRKNLPNEIISELLIRDRADRLGLTVTDAEVKDAIGRLKQQYNITTDEEFEKSLRSSGLTRSDMEGRLRDSLVTQKVFARELRNRQDLTDSELRERYNREKDRFRLPERARLREIVVLKPENPLKIDEARQKASDIAAATRQPNADFANIASTMSESGTRDQGGDLGEAARGDLVPEIDRVVFNATAGTILGPIETKSAFHVIKVEQRLPSEVPGFESVKDRLRRDASEETFQRDYRAYIDNLRKDAFILINDQYLPKA